MNSWTVCFSSNLDLTLYLCSLRVISIFNFFYMLSWVKIRGFFLVVLFSSVLYLYMSLKWIWMVYAAEIWSFKVNSIYSEVWTTWASLCWASACLWFYWNNEFLWTWDGKFNDPTWDLKLTTYGFTLVLWYCAILVTLFHILFLSNETPITRHFLPETLPVFS